MIVQRVRSHWRRLVSCYRKIFLVQMLLGAVFYANIYLHQLTNSVDGVWEGSFYRSGKWQISLGRFATLYIDKIRFGIQTDPLNTLLSILIFSLAMILFLDIFHVKSFWISLFISNLFLCSTVVCASLSYRFMSPVFALAFFFSVLGVWWLSKEEGFSSILLSGFFMCVQMGLYQAYLGVSMLLFLALAIERVTAKKKLIREWRYHMRVIGSCLTGALFYLFFLWVHLIIFHVTLSSYNGGNGYGVYNTLLHLGQSFVSSYEFFRICYFQNFYLFNFFQHFFPVYHILGCAVVTYMGLSIIDRCGGVINRLSIPERNEEKKKIIYRLCTSTYVIALLLLIPPALYGISFIATDTGVAVQMTGSYCILPSVMLTLLYRQNTERNSAKQNRKRKHFLYFAYYVVAGMLVLLLYGEIYQIQTDQQAMLSGRNATFQIGEKILEELIEEGLYDTKYTYCIVGTAAQCSMFCPPSPYEYSNYYAMYGCWWPDTSDKSWRGVFGELSVSLPIAGRDINDMVEKSLQFQKMPSFPEKGSISVFDNYNNIVIIKLK